MKELYGKGLANHSGPKLCADHRKVIGEALVGVHIGKPLSHVIFIIPGVDTVAIVEGNTLNTLNASIQRSGGV